MLFCYANDCHVFGKVLSGLAIVAKYLFLDFADGVSWVVFILFVPLVAHDSCNFGGSRVGFVGAIVFSCDAGMRLVVAVVDPILLLLV